MYATIPAVLRSSRSQPPFQVIPVLDNVAEALANLSEALRVNLAFAIACRRTGPLSHHPRIPGTPLDPPHQPSWPGADKLGDCPISGALLPLVELGDNILECHVITFLAAA
jgi:hypothetical protein